MAAPVEWAVQVVGLADDDDDDFHYHDGDAQDGGDVRDDDDGFPYGVHPIPGRDSSDTLEILESLGNLASQEFLGILDILGYLCVPCDLCPFYKLVL